MAKLPDIALRPILMPLPVIDSISNSFICRAISVLCVNCLDFTLKRLCKSPDFCALAAGDQRGFSQN
jgi:hypothetical protein